MNFSSIARDSDESSAHNVVTAVEDEFHFKIIKEEEVLRILRCLDTSKGVGMDMVSAKLLKIWLLKESVGASILCSTSAWRLDRFLWNGSQ